MRGLLCSVCLHEKGRRWRWIFISRLSGDSGTGFLGKRSLLVLPLSLVKSLPRSGVGRRSHSWRRIRSRWSFFHAGIPLDQPPGERRSRNWARFLGSPGLSLGSGLSGSRCERGRMVSFLLNSSRGLIGGSCFGKR